MNCDVCKSNQATVFLTQIVDGKMQKVNLCESCSKEKGVTDPTGFALADLAARCVRGGATLVQLRDKHSETRALIEEARAIKQALAPFAVPFVINDRVDVAMAGGADGVHLGQDDMAVEDARRLLGANAIIGLSIKSVAEAEAACSGRPA